MGAQISRNMLVAWGGDKPSIERVLHIDPDDDCVVMFELTVGGEPKGIPEKRSLHELERALISGAAHVVAEDPYAVLHEPERDSHDGALDPSVLRRETEITKEHRRWRDEIWEKLKAYLTGVGLFDRKRRGRIIAELNVRYKWSKPTSYKYLRRWWQAGQIKNAFLPHFDRCGGKGKPRDVVAAGGRKRGRRSRITKTTGKVTGTNVTIDIRRRLLQGLRIIFEGNPAISFATAHQLVLEKFFVAKHVVKDKILTPVLLPENQRPTLGQARYWYDRERILSLRVRRREGKRIWNLKYRPLVGDPTQLAFGPGALYQIDATVADVYLVSELDRNLVIGRPTLYLIVDVFSHLIVGFYAGLEMPSWKGALAALRNAIMEKTALWRQLGLLNTISESEWPSHHLPEAIVADRGEFASNRADDLVNALNITVHNTAPYRADWKPSVERAFGLLNHRGLKWLPGAVYDGVPRKDYMLDATLTLSGFRQYVASLVYEHNNVHLIKDFPFDRYMIEDKVEPYPVNLWKWGIQNRAGALRDPGLAAVWPYLLPQETATVTSKGLLFDGLYYTCQTGLSKGWFAEARIRGQFKQVIIYDPEDTSVLYVKLDSGRLEQCQLIGQQAETYGSCHWDDIHNWFEVKARRMAEATPKDQQRLADVHAIRADIVGQAREAKQRTYRPMSKKARKSGIKANRLEEVNSKRGQARQSPQVAARNVEDYVGMPDEYATLQLAQERRYGKR